MKYVLSKCNECDELDTVQHIGQSCRLINDDPDEESLEEDCLDGVLEGITDTELRDDLEMPDHIRLIDQGENVSISCSGCGKNIPLNDFEIRSMASSFIITHQNCISEVTYTLSPQTNCKTTHLILEEMIFAFQTFIDWSNDANAVVIDTESTGLDGVAFEVCVKHVNVGESLKFVCHTNGAEWEEKAAEMHAHRMHEIDHAPPPTEFTDQLSRALEGKRILAYGAEFDSKMIRRTFGLKFAMECVCDQYAVVFGDWNDYFGNFKLISLGQACKEEGIAISNLHDAESDVDLTIQLIHTIARIAKNRIKSLREMIT